MKVMRKKEKKKKTQRNASEWERGDLAAVTVGNTKYASKQTAMAESEIADEDEEYERHPGPTRRSETEGMEAETKTAKCKW